MLKALSVILLLVVWGHLILLLSLRWTKEIGHAAVKMEIRTKYHSKMLTAST